MKPSVGWTKDTHQYGVDSTLFTIVNSVESTPYNGRVAKTPGLTLKLNFEHKKTVEFAFKKKSKKLR